MPSATSTSAVPATSPADYQYFLISPRKLVIMTVLTYGLYMIYWFYQQWKVVRQHDQIMPLPRAIFSGLFAGSLFRRIGVPNHNALWAGYFLVSAAYRLPNPFDLLAFLAVLAPVRAQQVINARQAPEGVTDTYSTKAKVIGALGLVFLITVIVGKITMLHQQ